MLRTESVKSGEGHGCHTWVPPPPYQPIRQLITKLLSTMMCHYRFGEYSIHFWVEFGQQPSLSGEFAACELQTNCTKLFDNWGGGLLLGLQDNTWSKSRKTQREK